MASIVNTKYSTWKREKEANSIFWQFIDDERNRVLKEYSQGFLAGPVAVLAEGEKFELDDHLYSPLTDGLFVGEDCRDVLGQAIEWWELQLADIERLYSASHSKTES